MANKVIFLPVWATKFSVLVSCWLRWTDVSPASGVQGSARWI